MNTKLNANFNIDPTFGVYASDQAKEVRRRKNERR